MGGVGADDVRREARVLGLGEFDGDADWGEAIVDGIQLECSTALGRLDADRVAGGRFTRGRDRGRSWTRGRKWLSGS